MTNGRLREYLEDINAHYQELIVVSKEALKRKKGNSESSWRFNPASS